MASTLDMQLKLRVQEKMLNKEAAREEKNADKERAKAKAALRKGQREFAKVYANNAIRSQQQALLLQQNAAKISSMVLDLKMAEVQKKMAQSLDAVVKELEKSVGQMDMEKIAAAAVKYDKIRGRVSETNQIITTPEGSVEAEGEDLLSALENEIAVEMDMEVPEIPIADTPEKAPAGKVGPVGA